MGMLRFQITQNLIPLFDPALFAPPEGTSFLFLLFFLTPTFFIAESNGKASKGSDPAKVVSFS
jgi:hypothetical protein